MHLDELFRLRRPGLGCRWRHGSGLPDGLGVSGVVGIVAVLVGTLAGAVTVGAGAVTVVVGALILTLVVELVVVGAFVLDGLTV